LESWVGRRIEKKNLAQVFDSAAEVFAKREGDCSEHGVLLAAMLRARGIPARVAMGLVYWEQAYLYHMWTEAYLDGRWVPLDATLAAGGIGAAHLKIAHGSLQGASAFTCMFPVAEVAGRLKIEIVEAE
jgi:hypothetical protein